ncbi:hypothetical protein DMENIID0001_054280 [Sergentomyia squamirostris]
MEVSHFTVHETWLMTSEPDRDFKINPGSELEINHPIDEIVTVIRTDLRRFRVEVSDQRNIEHLKNSMKRNLEGFLGCDFNKSSKLRSRLVYSGGRDHFWPGCGISVTKDIIEQGMVFPFPKLDARFKLILEIWRFLHWALRQAAKTKTKCVYARFRFHKWRNK